MTHISCNQCGTQVPVGHVVGTAQIRCPRCGNVGTYTAPGGHGPPHPGPQARPPVPQTASQAPGSALWIGLGIGSSILGIVLGACLPLVGMVLGVVSVGIGAAVLAGKLLATVPKRQLAAAIYLAGGILIVLVSAVSFASQDNIDAIRAEQERNVEEQARAQQEAAEKARNEAAAREAALREEAGPTIAAVEQLATNAEASLEEGDYESAVETTMSALQQLGPLMSLSPPVEGVPELQRRLNEAGGTARSELRTVTALEEASGALDAEHADALAEFEALGRQLRAIEGLEGAVATERAGDIRQLQRRIERRRDRIRSAANRIRRERVYAERGLIQVGARELFQEFHNNEVRAESRYKNRRLAISGTVDGVRTDAFGDAIIDLRTSNQFMPIHAEVASRSTASRLSRGDSAELDCMCNGMVIGFVMLNDCKPL